MLQVLEEMWKRDEKSPALIVKEKKLNLILDWNELESICQTVMRDHQKEVILITDQGNWEERGFDALGWVVEIRNVNCLYHSDYYVVWQLLRERKWNKLLCDT